MYNVVLKDADDVRVAGSVDDREDDPNRTICQSFCCPQIAGELEYCSLAKDGSSGQSAEPVTTLLACLRLGLVNSNVSFDHVLGVGTGHYGLYEEACPLFLGKHAETSQLPVFPVLHHKVSLSDTVQILTEDGLVIGLLLHDILQDGSIFEEHVNIVTGGLIPLLLALLSLPLMISTLFHHPLSFIFSGFPCA